MVTNLGLPPGALTQTSWSDLTQSVLPRGRISALRRYCDPCQEQALVNQSGELEFIGTVMDITDLKRAEEMRAAMARERELFAQQRATELAKANEALRGCLDALASVLELDDFLGQVMPAITRQLGAVSSTLRVRNSHDKCNRPTSMLTLTQKAPCVPGQL